LSRIPKAFLEIDDDDFAKSVEESIQCALRRWDELKVEWSLE
jgi:hypothetical protein